MNDIKETEARVNITYQQKNGDLPDPVFFNATDADVKAWVTEAVRNGGVPGLDATPNADFADFVVDRFAATDVRPYNLLALRPKTPFGFASCEHCSKCAAKKIFGMARCGCGTKK